MELSLYFSEPYSSRALNAYLEAIPENWNLASKLYMYNLACAASDLSLPFESRILANKEIYNSLWYGWKLYRGAKPNRHWNDQQVFQFLNGPASKFNLSSRFDLRSIDQLAQTDLLQMLTSMTGIKRNADYPWVAASKFLHFQKPRLFPIYDIAYVWNGALNDVFSSDYKKFCSRNGLNPGERSAIFNLNYVRLAGEMIASSDDEFMIRFGQWFRTNTKGRSDAYHVLEDIETYFATAFEMTMLGAAHIEKNRGLR